MALLDFLHRKKKKNPSVMPVLPKDIYKQGSLDLIDTISPTALKISPRELELGEKFVRAFYTISYPRFLSDSWFSPVINLDKVLDVSIFIHPIDTEQALRGFQKKSPNTRAKSMNAKRKGLVRDPLLDTGYQDLESLRDSLQQAQEKLSMSVCISHSTEIRRTKSKRPRAISAASSTRSLCIRSQRSFSRSKDFVRVSRSAPTSFL